MSDRDTPRDQAKAWLRLAREDLLSARTLLEHQSEALRNAAFLSQQSAEKALKAVLAAHDVPIPRVHDLVSLVTYLPVRSHRLDSESLTALNPWAVAGRYALGRPPLAPSETRRLTELADGVIAVCTEFVADAPPSPDRQAEA